MTMPSGAALSLPTKLALLAASTELVALAIATRFVIVPGLSELAVLTAVLVCVPAAATYFVARFIVGRLTVPVVAAYRRLADGDFTAELPGETAGKDFLGLRDGFRAMADALARTLAEVRRTDGERRRLFADLAHELATPTTTLLGVVAALRSGLGDRDTLLDHLERECARLDRLVADVRELATVEDPGLVLERETCDVGALVTDVQAGEPLGGGLAVIGLLFVAQQVSGPVHDALSTSLGATLSNWLHERLLDACNGSPGLAHLESPELADQLSMARDFDYGLSGPNITVSMPNIGGGFAANRATVWLIAPGVGVLPCGDWLSMSVLTCW